MNFKLNKTEKKLASAEHDQSTIIRIHQELQNSRDKDIDLATQAVEIQNREKESRIRQETDLMLKKAEEQNDTMRD